VHLVGEEAGIQDKGLFVFFCVFLGLSVRCLVNINITLFAKKKKIHNIAEATGNVVANVLEMYKN
jgi:hypothetical protein